MSEKKITSTIISSAFEVHRTLGNGFLERVYQNALFYELKNRGLLCSKEEKIDVFYKGQNVGLYYADLLVERSVIIEIKTVEKIINPHLRQLKHYLNATGKSSGFLFNFKARKLEFIRVFP